MNLNTKKYLEPLMKEDNPPVTGAHVDTGEAGQYIMTWRCVHFHQLSEEENQGGHNVYVDLLTRDGKRMVGSAFTPKIVYGWAGMAVNETPTPLKLEKPEGEPGYNFPLWGDAANWCSVKDSMIPSDTVYGLVGGATHTSFYVVFQLQFVAVVPDAGEVDFVTISRKKVRGLLNELKQIGGMVQEEIKELEAWLT